MVIKNFFSNPKKNFLHFCCIFTAWATFEPPTPQSWPRPWPSSAARPVAWPAETDWGFAGCPGSKFLASPRKFSRWSSPSVTPSSSAPASTSTSFRRPCASRAMTGRPPGTGRWTAAGPSVEAGWTGAAPPSPKPSSSSVNPCYLSREGAGPSAGLPLTFRPERLEEVGRWCSRKD